MTKQEFLHMFSCCGGSGVSIWNHKAGQFECAECKSPKSTDSSYLGGHTEAPYQWERPSVKVCTCGAEKVHGKDTGHSSWCDKK